MAKQNPADPYMRADQATYLVYSENTILKNPSDKELSDLSGLGVNFSEGTVFDLLYSVRA